MKPILFSTTLLITALFGFGYALAQTVSPTTDPPISLVMFYPLFAIIAGSIPGSIRSWTKDEGFWHTVPGHFVITLFGGVAGVVSQVLQSGHVTRYSFISASIGAAMAWAVALKTQGKSSSSVVDSATDVAKKINVGLIIVFVGLSLQGCSSLPSVPTPSPQQYEAAFGTCMKKAGISDATGLGVQIWNILNTPGLTQVQIIQKLEALGIPAAGQAIEHTTICAVEAWTGANPIAASAKPTPAQAAARVFTARHAHAIDTYPGAESR